jgi:hypothetical protein
VNFDFWKGFSDRSLNIQDIMKSTEECFQCMSKQVSNYAEVCTSNDKLEVLCLPMSNQYSSQILCNFVNT